MTDGKNLMFFSLRASAAIVLLGHLFSYPRPSQAQTPPDQCTPNGWSTPTTCIPVSIGPWTYRDGSGIPFRYGTFPGVYNSLEGFLDAVRKTHVWQLAERWGLPKKIVDKRPTGDIFPGANYEDTIGMSYHVLDRILFELHKGNAPELIAMETGFDQTLIARVVQLRQTSDVSRNVPFKPKLDAV